MSRSGAPAPAVLAVTGLKIEARIAAGEGVRAVAGGGDPARLTALLEARLSEGVEAVLSFGIAGGLASGLTPGAVVVPDVVVAHDDATWPVDAAWRTALRARLPQAVGGRLAGSDSALADREAKAHLHAGSGAVAVDMESHIAARFAGRFGIPFAALRIVADPAERSLPQAALVGMRPDGTTDVAAVLRALARRPADLPALIRTGRDAQAAFRSLRACRNLIGDRLAREAVGLPRIPLA